MPSLRTNYCTLLGLLVLCAPGAPTVAAELPSWLPRYTLDVQLDLDQHQALVHERVTWTNRHARPATELILNNHAHFKLPEKDIGITAKMVEILRLTPGEQIDTEGRACDVRKTTLVEKLAAAPRTTQGQLTGRGVNRGDEPLHPPRRVITEPKEVQFNYQDGDDTTLRVPLPFAVEQGESVTVDLEIKMRLPQKQWRWGQWQGVTYLTNWLPVVAVYDDEGWHPVPFVPWHQPFYNEAGVYRARITIPADQTLVCSGVIEAEKDLGNGNKEYRVAADGMRDFAILCSARYKEIEAKAGNVRVRCFAFPEHEHYARIALQSAVDSITDYSRWIGPYPYPEFKVVESYFGWNGNECGGLILIDERIFAMTHMAEQFVDQLVAHETCHQWWYNQIGTNGYAETWMDESMATYFSYRRMVLKYGANDRLLKYPKVLGWMPNIRRDDYRYFGLYGTIGRGEATPVVQEMQKFGHIVNLFSMTYDKGSKIIGMIVERLGTDAFLDFIHRLYHRYQYRILTIADFQRELEEYTGQSWEDFFKNWLHGAGFSDWCLESVKIRKRPATWGRAAPDDLTSQGQALANREREMASREHEMASRERERPEPDEPIVSEKAPCTVTVTLRQKGEYTEPTVLGFALGKGEVYQVRVPIEPRAGVVEIDEAGARVETLSDHRVRVIVNLPRRPTQIAVDPDQVLPDREPGNNHWKPRVNVRFTPLYTFLDETDLTNYYDRWNVVFGPWFYGPTYDNPWFTRSTMFGFRAGAFRTQWFEGGVYTAYRTNYRDVVAGVDLVWPHWPFSHTEVGFIAEHRLAGSMGENQNASRGVGYARYIIDFGDSLYLQPFHFVETFGTISDNMLPFARETVPGAERFRQQSLAGLHHHINYLTPYWDAEGGFQMDTSYLIGATSSTGQGGTATTQLVTSQLAWVQGMPDGFGYLSDTRWAFRIFGAAGLPTRFEYYSMGGSDLFRGFDLAQRQGSLAWVASVEWRIPLAQRLHWDFCDRVVGIRNIYAALFSDTGAAYANGKRVGNIAEALGAGLRVDVAWFTFVERTILRFDTAKCINDNAPMQFWLGIEHPF